MPSVALNERFAQAIGPVLGDERVEMVFEANNSRRWPAGLVCTPTRVIFITTFGPKRVAAYRYADLDSVFLTKSWHWMFGSTYVQVAGKGAHAIALAGSQKQRYAAAHGAPNVMEFMKKAGRARAEEATAFLERRIAEARDGKSATATP